MYTLTMHGHTFVGNTLPALRHAVEAFRDREDLTMHDWPKNPAVMFDGSVLGYMSYNGRVWKTQGHPSIEVVF